MDLQHFENLVRLAGGSRRVVLEGLRPGCTDWFIEEANRRMQREIGETKATWFFVINSWLNGHDAYWTPTSPLRAACRTLALEILQEALAKRIDELEER